jgi:hypothetical protein
MTRYGSNPGATCECGRPKNYQARSCRSCRLIDGPGDTAMAIVRECRATDTVTIDQIALELGLDRLQAQRNLSRLVRIGVLRTWPDHTYSLA